MTEKEQFQIMKNELPYISKDGKYYQLKFYDIENNCLRFAIMKNQVRTAKAQKIPSYEEVKDKYNIQLEDTVPTPAQYFLRKVDESSNSNMTLTVSSFHLINYVKHHTEEADSIEAIEKLKEVIRTHKEEKVRKAAYASCVEIGVDGIEDLQKFVKRPERIETEADGSDQTETKENIPNRTNPLNKEKAIIIYMSLVKRYKGHRERITCGMFLNTWKEMFECDKYNVSKESYQRLHDKQIAAFAYAKGELDDKSYEEIEEYRKTVTIYPSREVPVELKLLGQSKGVIVTLAENINKHLSGFNIMVRESKYMSYNINPVPYGLSETAAKKILESLPTKSEIAKKEKDLMDILKNKSITAKRKKKVVKEYKAPYATHEFKKYMNRFTIYDCNSKELTLFCVDLCRRVGIKNLSNEKPIKYEFCAGSGKRNRSMKRAKGRKRANAKAVKERKGKK